MKITHVIETHIHADHRSGGRRAGLLYRSLQNIMSLPDDLEVYPAHFLGSACGAGMSGKPSSTIAFERRFNSLLTLPASAFVRAVTEQRPKPADMAGVLAFNAGRA